MENYGVELQTKIKTFRKKRMGYIWKMLFDELLHWIKREDLH